MLATLSLVIRHEALARRGKTIYRKILEREKTACQILVRPSTIYYLTFILDGFPFRNGPGEKLYVKRKDLS
jgi:hypothetical protein